MLNVVDTNENRLVKENLNNKVDTESTFSICDDTVIDKNKDVANTHKNLIKEIVKFDVDNLNQNMKMNNNINLEVKEENIIDSTNYLNNHTNSGELNSINDTMIIQFESQTQVESIIIQPFNPTIHTNNNLNQLLPFTSNNRVSTSSLTQLLQIELEQTKSINNDLRKKNETLEMDYNQLQNKFNENEKLNIIKLQEEKMKNNAHNKRILVLEKQLVNFRKETINKDILVTKLQDDLSLCENLVSEKNIQYDVLLELKNELEQQIVVEKDRQLGVHNAEQAAIQVELEGESLKLHTLLNEKESSLQRLMIEFDEVILKCNELEKTIDLKEKEEILRRRSQVEIDSNAMVLSTTMVESHKDKYATDSNAILPIDGNKPDLKAVITLNNNEIREIQDELLNKNSELIALQRVHKELQLKADKVVKRLLAVHNALEQVILLSFFIALFYYLILLPYFITLFYHLVLLPFFMSYYKSYYYNLYYFNDILYFIIIYYKLSYDMSMLYCI